MGFTKLFVLSINIFNLISNIVKVPGSIQWV